MALRLYKPWEDNDTTYEEVADALDDYTHTWVGDRIREWKNGEYRELVPKPSVQPAD